MTIISDDLLIIKDYINAIHSRCESYMKEKYIVNIDYNNFINHIIKKLLEDFINKYKTRSSIKFGDLTAIILKIINHYIFNIIQYQLYYIDGSIKDLLPKNNNNQDNYLNKPWFVLYDMYNKTLPKLSLEIGINESDIKTFNDNCEKMYEQLKKDKQSKETMGYISDGISDYENIFKSEIKNEFNTTSDYKLEKNELTLTYMSDYQIKSIKIIDKKKSTFFSILDTSTSSPITSELIDNILKCIIPLVLLDKKRETIKYLFFIRINKKFLLNFLEFIHTININLKEDDKEYINKSTNTIMDLYNYINEIKHDRERKREREDREKRERRGIAI